MVISQNGYNRYWCQERNLFRLRHPLHGWMTIQTCGDSPTCSPIKQTWSWLHTCPIVIFMISHSDSFVKSDSFLFLMSYEFIYNISIYNSVCFWQRFPLEGTRGTDLRTDCDRGQRSWNGSWWTSMTRRGKHWGTARHGLGQVLSRVDTM